MSPLALPRHKMGVHAKAPGLTSRRFIPVGTVFFAVFVYFELAVDFVEQTEEVQAEAADAVHVVA